MATEKLDSLYRSFFQKSRMFMYPVLDIKKGVSVTPIQTYMCWSDNYKPSDCKLICEYHLRNDLEFLKFEKNSLLGNKYYYDFKQLEENRGVYIFDMSSFKHDWYCLLNSEYSKMTDDHKNKIRNYQGINTSNYVYLDSYLEPRNYFNLYANLLGVPENILKETGELCEKLNIEDETLVATIKLIVLNNMK